MLAQHLEDWRSQFRLSLEDWLQRAPAEFFEQARPLSEQLSRLDPQELVANWQESRGFLAELQRQAWSIRDGFLENFGPTPLASLNAFAFHLERLAEDPGLLEVVGSALFREINAFESWASHHQIRGERYEALLAWLEELGLGLVSRQWPEPGQVRSLLSLRWHELCEEHTRQSETFALASPTRSPRWNSWLLLLETCEQEQQDPELLLEGLEALEQDVEELLTSLGDSPALEELVADFGEASEELRQALQRGKSLKGWSQIFSPILLELDSLTPDEPEVTLPSSRLRELCGDFEAGRLSIEHFHRHLEEFKEQLVASRQQSRVKSAQHPVEAEFVQALAKLEGGLEILAAVERAGQASRLEMGCTLIDDGLAQIQKLEAGDG